MFEHQGMLKPALAPVAYHGEAYFQLEQDRIFRDHWHFVGLASAMARPGDYLAATVLDHPVVVWNIDGELRAFQNVCAHRHAVIVGGCGHAERLRCGYHGWEYDADGHVAKIPDGRSFKGLKVHDVTLPRYRAEALAGLLFVCLSPDTPGLRAALGPAAALIERWFGAHRLAWTKVSEHAVNWKVICENAVESYHVPTVHPNTFKYYREEALHRHTLGEGHSSYLDLEPWRTSMAGYGAEALARLLIARPTLQRFTHTHVYPNLLLYYGDLFSDFAVVEPLGPERSRHVQYAFVPEEIRARWLTEPVQRAYTAYLKTTARKIFGEDTGPWARVQQGLRHTPHAGVLSAREERVYHFQRWLAARTDPAT